LNERSGGEDISVLEVPEVRHAEWIEFEEDDKGLTGAHHGERNGLGCPEGPFYIISAKTLALSRFPAAKR